MNEMRYRSAFVPHDLPAPLVGATNGPLAGLTCAVKDMYDIAGEVAGCGNPDWLAGHAPAAQNCPAVQVLLDAGASIIGKTICDEFFFSVTGANAHYGTPVNARAPGRLPGGSSSGSAAAVGANLCDFALGSDTGGSVRIPASFNGVWGLRPTHGRIDTRGVQDMAASLDVPGWFAATPGVFRKVGQVLLDGRRVPATIQRVVVLEDAFEQADADVTDLLRTLLEFMSDDLPALTHGKIAPDGFDPWREAMRVIQGYEVWRTYGDFVIGHKPHLGPGIQERMAFSASVTQAQADAATAVRQQAREHILAVATPGTVLVQPTAPCIAPRTDLTPTELEDFRVRVMRLTCLASLTGLPQMNIPAGMLSGCPVGLSFIGWHGGDEALLDLANVLAPHCGISA
jgi:amidase